MASTSLPSVMRAVIHIQSSDSLSFSKTESLPKPAPDECLLKNEASAITTGELTWPRPPEQDKSSPGVESSSTIVTAPKNGKFKAGDKIYLRAEFPLPGGACGYSTAKEECMALRPKNVSAEEAASVPVSALTAWQGLFEKAGLEPDFDGSSRHDKLRILVNGASGGAGIWFVQLARAAGYHVTGTCSSKNVSLVKSLGADEVMDYTKTSIPEYAAKKGKFDLVFDCVGGKSREDSWQVVAENGKFFTIVAPDDEAAEWKFDLDVPEGVSQGVQGKFYIMEPNGDTLGKVAKLIEKGTVKAVVDSVWKLEEYEKAFERLWSGRAVGKVVFKVVD